MTNKYIILIIAFGINWFSSFSQCEPLKADSNSLPLIFEGKLYNRAVWREKVIVFFKDDTIRASIQKWYDEIFVFDTIITLNKSQLEKIVLIDSFFLQKTIPENFYKFERGKGEYLLNRKGCYSYSFEATEMFDMGQEILAPADESRVLNMNTIAIVLQSFFRYKKKDNAPKEGNVPNGQCSKRVGRVKQQAKKPIKRQ